MNDRAKDRLRVALNALTPPAHSLAVPELPDRPSPDRWREAVAVATACLLALTVAGSMIWFRSHASTRTPASPSAPVPSAVAPPAPTPTPAAVVPPPPPSPAPTATPRCHTGDLAATIRALNSGAGQRYAALVLTNASGHPCQVYGYVGMLLLDGNRQSLPTDVVRNASPAPQVLTLMAGQAVFSQLHWTVVPGTGEAQTAQCEPQPASVEITPPDETTQLVVPWNMDAVCLHGRIDVTAAAPGSGPPF